MKGAAFKTLLLALLAMDAARASCAPGKHVTDTATAVPDWETLSLGGSWWTGENWWDSYQDSNCGNGVFTGMESWHDNGKEDRRFKLKCQKFINPATGADFSTQTWGGYGWTGWDSYFETSHHTAINRMQSHHNNGREDRIFHFSYATIANREVNYINIGWTGWTGWDAYQKYECGSSKVIAGFESKHDDDFEDRIWRFKCANVQIKRYCDNCDAGRYSSFTHATSCNACSQGWYSAAGRS